MSFDYFYGTEGEHFRYYQIPAVMLEDKNYQMLSARAKLLYSVLLSLVSLSRLNHWIEEDTNRVYVVCPQKEMASKLGCSLRTVTSIIDELKDFGLIERRKQGQGRPELIFVKNFATGFIKEEIERSKQISGHPEVHTDPVDASEDMGDEEVSDTQKLRVWESEAYGTESKTRIRGNVAKAEKSNVSDERDALRCSDAQNLRVKTRKNCVSRDAKTACQDVQDLRANYIKNNYLNRIIYNPSIHPSVHPDHTGNGEIRDVIERVKEQVDYPALIHDRPGDKILLDCLVVLMAEVYASRKKLLHLAGEEHLTAEVQKRFQALNMEHMRYILSCLKENQKKITNIRQYMLTTLYHAPATMGSYHQLLAGHHENSS